MTNISTLGQNIFIRSQILNLQNQMNTLQEQVSSGKKSTVFSGISQVSGLSLQLNNAQSATDEFLNNIANAKSRIQPVQSVLQRITEIADSIRNDALVASSDALPMDKGNGSLKAAAQQRLKEIAGILNTKVGNEYVFGGRESNVPPMPDFGDVSNASTILGQTAALNVSYGLTTVRSTGDRRYDAIADFLNNGLTTTQPGGTGPAAFGYAGETGEPGGSTYRLTTQALVAQGLSTITVAPGTAMPAVGQYIEFGTVPPHNAAYRVSAINTATGAITFTRIPVNAGAPGLEFAVPAGTAVNLTTPAAVTSVSANNGLVGADTVGAGGAAIGATSLPVTTIGNYTVGDRIQINGGGAYYDITSVDTATSTVYFKQVPNGGGLAVAAVAGQAIQINQGYAPGSTQINVASTAGVTAGMALKFSNSNAVYTVVNVVSATQLEITQESTSSGAGLEYFVPPPIAGQRGHEVTVSFGQQVDPLNVRIDNGVALDYGVRADNPAIRTVLNALFALATTDLNQTTEAGFRQIAVRAATDLQNGSKLITAVSAQLGVKENQIAETETRHKDFQVVLATQLDRTENVDMAEAVSKLTQTQTNLQASYQLLASLRDLSLVNFL